MNKKVSKTMTMKTMIDYEDNFYDCIKNAFMFDVNEK